MVRHSLANNKKIILHNKKPNTINIRLLLQASRHSLLVRMTNCKTEGAGIIPYAFAKVFALMADYQRIKKGSSGIVPPRTISKEFLPRTLKGSSRTLS